MPVVRRAHPAMQTRFEAILVGDDVEHLDAVCTSVFEEVDRVERLLSRFDPASEVARINQTACSQRQKISVELADVLYQCRVWYERTGGAFAVLRARDRPQRLSWQDIEVDTVARTVMVRHGEAIFDFGSFGKGYALDRAGALMRQYGVAHALLHAGTSSVIAIGRGIEQDRAWQVAIGTGSTTRTVELENVALSTSATVDEQNSRCETVDPRTGAVVAGGKLCFVVAETAAVGEILSTALLILGPAGARRCADWQEDEHHGVRYVGWIDDVAGEQRLTEASFQPR